MQSAVVFFFSAEEITSGQFYILSKYNGKELYSNHWDLCTIDEEKEDRVVFCPVVGKKNYVKDMKIPSYLPKVSVGRVGWLCLTSHRQRGHLETAPPFIVPCEGREAR